MNLALSTPILQALETFRRRRRLLLKTRAGLAAAAVLIGAFLLIALLDWMRWMPEGLRPWLSLVVYAGAGWMAWRVSVPFFIQMKSTRGAARLVETAEPALRERLLAAVELAESEGADSPEFREQLQTEVTGQMSDLNAEKLLPWRMIFPWMKTLAAVMIVLILVCFIPGFHVAGFLARAALPFANLARPASVKLVIVTPAPASTMVPIASEADIAVDVIGPQPEAVYLEVLSQGGSPRRSEMLHQSGGRYEGRVAVGQADVRYRLHAADAISPWETLVAKARPRVVEFVKTVVPPAYSGLPEVQVAEDHGDVEALEGSIVRLKLKANQPIGQGEMVLNPDQPTRAPGAAVSFEKGSEETLLSELSVSSKHDSWQIKLTGKETGFTNDEASPWSVTAVQDLPPIVQILEPMEQLQLLPDEAVRLTGMASDDVGIKSVQLNYTINGTNGKTKDLNVKAGREAQVETVLALGPLGVKAADAVTLKLIATDVKGQVSESPPVRVIILDQTVDPELRNWANESRRLAQQAQTLAEQTREMRRAMEQVKKSTKAQKKDNQPMTESETAMAAARTKLEQVTQRADDLWEQLKQAAQAAPTQLQASNTLLLGEKVAQMRRESLTELKKAIQEDNDNVEPLRRSAQELDGHAEVTARAARMFAAEDSARILAMEAMQLHRQENLLTENSLQANRDAAQRPQWQEQQRAAITAAANVRKNAEALMSQLDHGQQRQIEELNKQVNEAANDLRDSLDKPDQTKSPEHLYGAADNLRQRLGRTAEAARNMSEQMAVQAAQHRERLQRMGNPALVALEKARGMLAAAQGEAQAAAKDPRRQPRLDRDGLLHEQKAQKELADAARQLEDQAALREQNLLTNDQSALDANRASRALDQLAGKVEAAIKAPADKKVEALTQASESGAKMLEVTRTLNMNAVALDALKGSSPDVPDPRRVSNPFAAGDNAQLAAENLRLLPDLLRRNRATNELVSAAQQAADISRGAADQFKNLARMAAIQPNQPLHTQPAEQLAVDAYQRTESVLKQIQEQGDAAREQLAALTPEVSEMMKQVASNLKGTQEQTQAAADEAKAEKPVEAVAEKAQGLQAEAAQDEQAMESLQAALRQEANAANLMQDNQRQTARTADLALAQMQQKAPQIAQNLKQAAQASESKPQAQALQGAADAQQQTAQALEQLAENMAKMEQGEQLSEQELAAMQKMEKDLAVQEPLDEAYQRAQQLAEMVKDASQDPAAVLKKLEEELPKNGTMRKALAELSKNAAQAAEQTVAEKSNQPASLGLVTEQAAHDLARVARHQGRLGEEAAAKQTAQLSNELSQTAQETKKDLMKATPEAGQQAQGKASQAAKAAELTAMNTPPSLAPSPFEQVQGALLAQALDQLDQKVNPMQSPQQGAGQQESQAGEQKSAQQSLSDAQQSQQQQMADARNQGQVPGSQKGQQQTAQNSSTPPKPSQSQSANAGEEGGHQNLQLKDGVLGGQVILVDGDWGHLPSKMAADLTEATRTEAAPEYRAAIENYYKAIATKAKQ